MHAITSAPAARVSREEIFGPPENIERIRLSRALMPSLSDPELTQIADDRRRRGLLMAAAGMLALGVVLNISRLTSPPQVVEAMHRPDIDEGDNGVEAELEAGGEGQHRYGVGTRHKGEEGKMGKPSPSNRSGLYAMKGPKSARVAMAQDKKEEDVWGGLTGTEVGEAYGVGGLGLVGTGRGGGGTGEGTIGLGNVGTIGKGAGGGYGRGSGSLMSRRAWPSTHAVPPNPNHQLGFVAVADDARSTFSIDVDTASYSSVRRGLKSEQLPAPDSVRVEEFINYFDYDYAMPQGEVPLSLAAEVGPCPWNEDHALIHVGVQGREIAAEALPPRNLVFLVDVSGSMHSPDKLPLVRHSLTTLTKTLRAEDTISIVTYAGQAGVVLSPTSGADQETIITAIAQLASGGGTNGAAGIQQAYALAEQSANDEGINRVILATDGDFNVGVASHDALVDLIEAKREGGVELSVLGVGLGHRDHTMEQLADHGNGNYAYIDSRAEARKVLVEEAGGTLVTIAKDVKLQVEFDARKVEGYRLIGYDNRRLAHRDFDNDRKDAGEIGAGHTVTALYEVIPADCGDTEAPWMTLGMRYKPPKGKRSTKVSVPIVAEVRDLEDTSDNFRFSAAVASMGMKLRSRAGDGVVVVGPSGEVEPASYGHGHEWAAISELARGAVGVDRTCRRHEFIDLVRAAASASGTPLAERADSCTPGEGITTATDVEPTPPDLLTPSTEPVDRPTASAEPAQGRDWTDTALDVLRLLPPLLALPLFVMAWRRPRRREHGI